MKEIIFAVMIILGLTSCKPKKNKAHDRVNSLEAEIIDTIIIGNKNFLKDFYSKSYFYYWLTEKDTLDFSLGVNEWKSDSSVHITVHHKKPILFSKVLIYIRDCLPKIKEEFDLAKTSSLFFESPIYYKDLCIELSAEYEQKFGKKFISHKELNDFLIESSLNSKLDTLLVEMDKQINRYSIEKFHLLNKENYNYYLPDVDLKQYPDFSLFGAGVYMELE